MPKFTHLHFLLGTGRPHDREEAEQLIRKAFQDSGNLFAKAAELLDISDRQLRRYCNQLGIDLFQEVDSKRAVTELEGIRRQLDQENYQGAAAALAKLLAERDLSPDVLALAYSMRAEARLFSGDEEGAREHLRTAFRAKPEFDLPPTARTEIRKLYAGVLEEIAAQLLARARRLRRSGARSSRMAE